MTTTVGRPHVSGWCAPIDGKPDCAGCAQHPNKPPCHCPTDRNQLAKVLGVEKATAPDPEQLDLFGGIVA